MVRSTIDSLSKWLTLIAVIGVLGCTTFQVLKRVHIEGDATFQVSFNKPTDLPNEAVKVSSLALGESGGIHLPEHAPRSTKLARAGAL